MNVFPASGSTLDSVPTTVPAAWFSRTLAADSVMSVGAAFVSATVTVIVLAVGSRSIPPFAVPPSSCTWKVNVGEPVALATGTYTNLPAVIAAAVTDAPAVTVTPLFLSDPAVGSVVIFKAASTFAGESAASVNPKSPAVNT